MNNLQNKTAKKILAMFLVSSLVLSVAQMPYADATPLFGSATNLSTATEPNEAPRMATAGNNVYVVWADGTDIQLRASANNGVTFGAQVSPSNSGGSGINPSIAASGNNVYVVWEEAGEILFSRSTNNGGAFNTPVQLTAGGAPTSPKIAASGSNVYVIWEQGNDIRGQASSDDGVTFSATANLSNNAGASTAAQIEASGTTAYVVWRDTTPEANGDILFCTISNAGAACAATVNLSNNAGNSQLPQLAVSGTTAYVVWRDTTPEANGDIFFSAVTNTGMISVAATNLSSNTGTSTNPRVAVETNDVYVIWQDNLTSGANNIEIMFRRSSNNGASFDSQVNLSNTGATSSFPYVSASGSEVNVAWKDLITGNNGDIFSRSSSDRGATFGGLRNLSSDTAQSDTPIIASTSTHAYVTWTGDLGTATPDVFFATGAHSARDVRFDATLYGTSGTATITVTDPASNTNAALAETINISVISTADAVGIAQFRLTETGINSGVFTAQLTFTTGASSASPCTASCVLKVAAGNTITATFNSQVAHAFISPRTLDFRFNGISVATYELDDGKIGDPGVIVRLTDSDANTDSTTTQSVDITVTSTTNPSGITLRLSETGVNTGIFENTNLIFMRGDNTYSIGGSATVQSQTTGLGHDSDGVVNTIPATVQSTTSPGGFTLTLTETGQNTATFTGTLQFSSTGPSGGNTVQVSAGDIVTIRYNNGGIYANGIVGPNPDPRVGAIRAAALDTITASYLGTTDTATIAADPAPGGGGGGIVAPSVVVNVVAGIFARGSGSSGSAASIDSASLATFSSSAEDTSGKTQDTDLTKAKSTKTVKTGEKLVLSLDITSNEGIQYMTHVELGVNNKGDPNKSSDTLIIYDKYKPNQVTIVDPNKLFASADFKLLPKDARSGTIQFEITFAKPMDTSDIRLLAWDIKRNFVHKIYEDAVKVEKSDTQTTETIQDTKPKTQEKVNTEKLKKIMPQKLLKKEKQKEKLDKKAEKKHFDKLKKNTAKEKQEKKNLVKKLQNKAPKTISKK